MGVWIRDTAMRSHGLMSVLVLLMVPPSAFGAEPNPARKPFAPEQLQAFEQQVRPILEARCLKCHSGGKAKGGLRLDSREAILKGGDLGPAFEPGDPSKSLILKAIQYDELEMPPNGKLAAGEIEKLTQWIKTGAAWPESSTAPGGPAPASATPAAPAPNQFAAYVAESKKTRLHQPVARPKVPAVRQASWCRSPVDAFVLARLEANQLATTAQADRVTLIRRLTYDLIGLPPTPSEVDAFLNDKSPTAYEHLVDRLLDSPLYGQKWGRHWLDLVRYAETNGFERDSAKPAAFRYRDYVIASFNKDKPYDQFLREQIAGDEIDPNSAEALIATGYYRLGIWDDEPADRPTARYEVLDSIVSTTGQVMLGMTINCARCHDHKVDPIPQRDYYRLLAFFIDITDQDGKNLKPAKLPSGRKIDVMCVREQGTNQAHVLLRGNPALLGSEVDPGIPEVLDHGASSFTKGPGKRRALAEWLTDPKNPRTARVFANRLWQYHFGRGIIPTSNDYGKLGEAATHPDLLDWLAAEFVDAGWRIKPLHRTILLSNAYRMDSHANAQGLDKDPANHHLWRFAMRRLAAEEVRDSILSVSGALNMKAGGPSIYPPIPKEVLAGQSIPGKGWFTSPPLEAARRSVFVHVKRSLIVPILATHDSADTDTSCPVRYTTTVPTQALGLLNGEFGNEQAELFARRLEREAPGDLAAQVGRAIRLTTSQNPEPAEVASDLAFIRKLQIERGLDAHTALVQYGLMALNANAFLYLD